MIAASATWTRTAVLALCALSAAAFQFPATLLHTRCVLRATVPNQAVDRLPLLRHAPRPARGLALRATGGGQDAADGDEEKGGGEYDMEAFREMMQGSWDKVILSLSLFRFTNLVGPGLVSARKLKGWYRATQHVNLTIVGQHK